MGSGNTDRGSILLRCLCQRCDASNHHWHIAVAGVIVTGSEVSILVLSSGGRPTYRPYGELVVVLLDLLENPLWMK